MSEVLMTIAIGGSALGRERDARSWQRSIQTVQAALTEGPGFIDTSNAYAQGRSEQVIGQALRSLGPDARARVITKVDADPDSGVLDRDRVLRSFEQSMQRLGLERVPLLHLHDPYTITLEDALAPGGAVQGLAELREAGLAGGIGIAAGPTGLVGRYVDTGIFDAVLIHNRFTLADGEARDVFTRAHERGMTVFNAAPFGGGILATGDRDGARYAYRPASDAFREWVRAVQRCCGAERIPIAAAALQYSLRSPVVDVTVAGAGSADRVREIVRLARMPVPEHVWKQIEALGPAPVRVDAPADAEGGR